MKACSVIGLMIAAAIFAAMPISPQVTPRGLELSVDQAQAITYGRHRRVERRGYRRAARWAAFVGALAASAAASGYYGGGYYGGPYYGSFGTPNFGQPVGGGGGQFYYSGYGAPWW